MREKLTAIAAVAEVDAEGVGVALVVQEVAHSFKDYQNQPQDVAAFDYKHYNDMPQLRLSSEAQLCLHLPVQLHFPEHLAHDGLRPLVALQVRRILPHAPQMPKSEPR